MRRLLAIAWLAGCAACAPETPDAPTWLADVRPILAANCIRCHGSPAIGGAPTGFRLDVYDDTVVDGRTIRGARSMAEFIAARDDEPPRGAQPSGRQREILDRWAAGGAPLGAREGNRAPTVSLTDGGTFAGIAALQVLVLDDDRDLVIGELRAGDQVVGALHAGRQDLFWDTSVVPPGVYPLRAIVDDGSGERGVELGTRTVEHADTAPRFTLLAPGWDALVRDRATLRFTVTDPDPAPGQRLTLNALHADQTIPIAVGIDPAVGSVEWDTAAVADAPGWRIEARFTDSGDGSPRTVSWPVIVSHAQTQETYEALKPLVDRACAGCHPSRLPLGPEFTRVDDLRARAGLAWRKVQQQRECPPPSTKKILGEGALLSEEERVRLGEWLQAGAP